MSKIIFQTAELSDLKSSQPLSYIIIVNFSLNITTYCLYISESKKIRTQNQLGLIVQNQLCTVGKYLALPQNVWHK